MLGIAVWAIGIPAALEFHTPRSRRRKEARLVDAISGEPGEASEPTQTQHRRKTDASTFRHAARVLSHVDLE
jgi:hypothetical protein